MENNIFTGKRDSVFVGLSFFCVIFAAISRFFLLWGNASIYIIPIALVAGIFLGILGFLHGKKLNSPGKMQLALGGAFLNLLTLVFVVYNFLSIIGVIGDSMKAVVSESWAYAQQDNWEDASGRFCINKINGRDADDRFYVIEVFEETKIYETYGIFPWQKKLTTVDALQAGQVVKIKYSGWVILTYPPIIHAIEVTIQKGLLMEYESGCGWLGSF